jgi:uncharacterized protein (TIGR00288 family)
MASSPENTSMALFCDFENVALGVRETQHDKFDIKRVLERLLLKGSIVVKKAYCDWDRYKQFKGTMHEANFELIEIPHVRQSGKNSADIRLVVDALDLCYTKSHVDTFVIISGDSDFSPLVSKLRENNKQVIGVGVKQSTSDLLIANCDEFIFYDDLVREGQRAAARRAAQDPTTTRRAAEGDARRKEDPETRRAKAIELAVETLEALGLERGDGGKIRTSVLKDAIKRRRPDFNETYFGFRSFGALLEDAQAKGLLDIVRDEKANAYVQRAALAGSRSGEARTHEHAAVPASVVASPAPSVAQPMPPNGETLDAENTTARRQSTASRGTSSQGRPRGGRTTGARSREQQASQTEFPLAQVHTELESLLTPPVNDQISGESTASEPASEHAVTDRKSAGRGTRKAATPRRRSPRKAADQSTPD